MSTNYRETGADQGLGHVFDQTNGLLPELEGESDGTVEGELYSAAERERLHEGDLADIGLVPGFEEDEDRG